MLERKPDNTPIDVNHEIRVSTKCIAVNKESYQRLVGKLVYLSHTRPDIAFVASVISQVMHAPNEEHMNVVVKILRYLKGTIGKGLLFTKNSHLEVEAYSNAD